jgi:hypothetical protein
MMQHPSSGGSNNSYTLGSFIKICKVISPGLGETFVDLGSGYGLPVVAVAAMHGIKAYGLEIQKDLNAFSVQEVLKLPNDLQLLVSFSIGDILHLGKLPAGEIIYMFDRAFTPDVKTHIMDLLSDPSATWRIIASTQVKARFENHEGGFPPLDQVGSVPARMRGSSGMVTMYIYKRSGAIGHV